MKHRNNDDKSKPSRTVAAIYARRAVSDPAEIRQQVDACRAAAARLDLSISDDHIYTEMGVPGKTRAGRTALTSLLAATQVTPCPFQTVLTVDLARMARNLTVVSQILQQLHEAGVTVHFVDQNVDSRDPQFTTTFDMLVVFDQCIRDGAKERRREKKRQEITAANKPSSPPASNLDSPLVAARERKSKKK